MSSTTPIVILYRGGRLPSWQRLTAEQRTAYQDEHVDLMLTVAEQHGLLSIEGYRLIAPQGDWQRWWTMKFPDLAGAEAWMEAEVAPPYGTHGFYHYELARPWSDLHVGSLPPAVAWPRSGTDPRVVPPLTVHTGTAVVLTFGVSLAHDSHPGADGLRHAEAYQLLGPGTTGQVALLHEFDSLALAEAWIEQDAARATTARSYHICRRWAPEYFAGWPPE